MLRLNVMIKGYPFCQIYAFNLNDAATEGYFFCQILPGLVPGLVFWDLIYLLVIKVGETSTWSWM